MNALDSRTYFENQADEFQRSYKNIPCHDWVRRITFVYHKRVLRRRVGSILELCGEVKNKNILDVGFGQGVNSIELAKRGAYVDGIDFSESMLKLAKANAREAGVEDRCDLFLADILNFISDKKYEIVFAIGVTDYIQYPQRVVFFRKLDALSSESIILSFPKRWHIHALVRKLWLNIFKKCPVYFFSKVEYEKLFHEFGYEIQKVIDIGILWVVKGKKA